MKQGRDQRESLGLGGSRSKRGSAEVGLGNQAKLNSNRNSPARFFDRAGGTGTPCPLARPCHIPQSKNPNLAPGSIVARPHRAYWHDRANTACSVHRSGPPVLRSRPGPDRWTDFLIFSDRGPDRSGPVRDRKMNNPRHIRKKLPFNPLEKVFRDLHRCFLLAIHYFPSQTAMDLLKRSRDLRKCFPVTIHCFFQSQIPS